jgi:hypothetical protein
MNMSDKTQILPKITIRIGTTLSLEDSKSITNARLICSAISSCCCVIIIILYIIMFLKIKCFKREKLSSMSTKASRGSKWFDEDTSSENTEDLLENFNRTRTVNKNKIKINSKKTINDTNQIKMGSGSHMIFFLISCILGYCVCSFLNYAFENRYQPQKGELPCTIQGMLQNYFDMSSILWIASISRLTLLGTKNSVAGLKKAKGKFYIIFIYCSLIPLIISILPLFTDSFGPSGPWCWMDLAEISIPTYFWVTLINIYTWIHIIYTTYAIFLSVRYFVKRKKEINAQTENSKEVKVLEKYMLILVLIPFFAIITRLPSTINRVYSMFSSEDSFALYMFHSIIFTLQGFFYSVINSYFYRNVFKMCRKTSKDEDSSESKDLSSLNV